ncbi:hypothetical protein Tco_1265928 [Tanacetum coccineum]
MEAHLALTQPTQVNKITNSSEICSGPHDTQYCMEDPEQAFVEYASSFTDEAGGNRACALRNFDLGKMELENSQNNALAKLPILKLGEYEMWEIRIKQYFQIQDYALWEVIENGNLWVPIPVTAPESDSESLDSIFNRLQKLVSRLAILGVDTPPEDLNVKFLRSLPSEWDTHVVTDKSKRGFGYTAVPSPHPLILNRPTPLDLSYSGLEEFKQPKTNDDSLTQQPKTVIETSSVVSPFKVDKAWKEKFFHPANHVRVEEPQKARENTDAPIIEDWVSDDEEEVESIPKVEKKIPTATKKESVKTVKPSRRTIRPNINTVKARGFNVVKPSACYVWRPIKPNGASLTFNKYNYIDSNSQLNEKGFVDSGCSRHMSGNIAHLSDFKEFDGGYVTFGGGANGGRITGKGTIKTDKLDLKEVYKKVLRVPSTTTSTGSRLKACKKLLQVKTALELQNVKGSCRLAKRSMIRSLMYLTASRPDIMFAVCACARFQVSPKTSHLLAVKRIFRYLKGKPSLGLWYSKDSPLELVAYTDSDYAGATLDRKSTTGGCQFLGNRLISWQCKKQTVVATSTTEAEYVAAASCCGQVLWIQNQLLDYGYNFMNTVIYIDNTNLLTKDFDDGRFQYLVSIQSKTTTGKDFPKSIDIDSLPLKNYMVLNAPCFYNEALASPEQTATAMASPKQTAIGKDSSNPFMADFCDKHNMVAFLEKSTGSAGFHQIIDFITRSHIYYALTKKPEVCVSFIKQFWRSAEALTDGNGDVKINATIDGHSLSITEDKLTFQKGAFSPQWRFLIHTILHCLSPKKTAWEQFSSNIAAAVICLATNRKFNFSRMIFDHMVSNISSPHKFLMYPRFIQLCLDMQRHKFQQHTRFYSVPSLTMKVFSNMKRSTKGFSGQEVPLFPTMIDATEPSPSPSRITSSPSPTPTPSPSPQPSPTQPSPSQPSPTQPSPTQPDSANQPPTPHDSPLHAVHSHGSEEGSLKLQELMNLINTLSDRVGVLEADLTKTKKTYSSAYTKLILRVKKLEAQLKVGKARRHSRFVLSDTEIGDDDSSKQGRKFSTEGVQDDEGVHEKASNDTELFVQEVTPTELIQDQEASGKASDEGRSSTSSTVEEEPKKKSKKELEQEQLSYVEAVRLEEQMNEEQRAQIARDEEIARQWDEEERKRAMDAAKTTKKIDWNDPSVIRYHSLKMKPKTIAQARRNMIKYLKNQGNYKISDFKGMSYNDIRPIFEKIWDFNQNIKPMDAEQGSGKQKSPQKSPEKSPAKEKSPEKVVEEESETQEELKEGVKEPTAKRKKSIPRKTTRKRQNLEEDGEKDELKGFLDIVPREEAPIEIESLSTKFPIVDWKTCVLTETLMFSANGTMDGNSYVDRKEVSLKPRDVDKDVK